MEYYDGIHLRDTLNDNGEIPSPDAAPTYSPDVICYQNNTLSWYDAMHSYDRRISMPFLNDNVNNIYIRAKNRGSAPRTAKVRALYASLNLLYTPHQWKPLATVSGQTEVQLVTGDGGTMLRPDEIGIVREAFWLSKLLEPTLHHCILAYCQSTDESWLELPSSFPGNAALWTFLRWHSQIAYNNIQIIPAVDHTLSLPVNFGNHDPMRRRFVLHVSIKEGAATLTDSALIIQCTDVLCPVNEEQTFHTDQLGYACSFSVPPNYEGTLNFICRLKHPEQTNCLLEVENYLIVEQDETVIVSSADVLHSQSNQLEGAAKLGDFQLRIIEGEWGNVDGLTLLKGPLAPAANGMLHAKKGRKTLRLDD